MKAVGKVLVICTGLYTPGGIERATVNLVNLLSSTGEDITLLILDKSADSFYEISSTVQILNKDLHFGITEKGNPLSRKAQFLLHIIRLKKILKQINPATIISTDYSHTIAAYLAKSKKVKLFSWEHHHFNWIRKNHFWQTLFNHIYPKIDSIICLNNTEAELFKAIGCTTSVIPNFIDRKMKYSDLESKALLTVGWLIKRKGIDLIPEIAKLVRRQHPDWRWTIIGKGELKDFLKAAIKEKKLENFVFVREPITSNLDQVYLDTSLYIMPSRFECFPMVLLEAQSYGIPCIAFDCPTGPADIINNSIDGLLIQPEDVEAMAASICSLIADKERRKKMGENAHHNMQRFSPEKILLLWQKLIEEN